MIIHTPSVIFCQESKLRNSIKLFLGLFHLRLSAEAAQKESLLGGQTTGGGVPWHLQQYKKNWGKEGVGVEGGGDNILSLAVPIN